VVFVAGSDANKFEKRLSDKQQCKAEDLSNVVQSTKCHHVSADLTLVSEGSMSEVGAPAERTSNLVNDLCSGNNAVVCSTVTDEPAFLESSPHSNIDDSGRERIASTNNSCCTDESAVSMQCNDYMIGSEDVFASMSSQTNCKVTEEVKSSSDTEHCYRDCDIVNVQRLTQKCSNQSSIHLFFKSVPKTQQNVSAVLSKSDSPMSNSLQKQSFGKHESSCKDISVSSCRPMQTFVNNVDSTQISSFTGRTRKCPFYKWIPGMALHFWP